MSAKFQGQKTYRKKVIQNLPMYQSTSFGKFFFAANFDSLPRAQNLFFSMNCFLQEHLCVNNICEKFQGQKIYKKKDIGILPVCVDVKKNSLLPTSTPFLGVKVFSFWHEIFVMRSTLCQ